MPDTKFLEEYPLYRKFYADLTDLLAHLEKPPIHMFCLICNSEQTFNMVSEYRNYNGETHRNINEEVIHVVYKCAACQKFDRHFLLRFYELDETNKEKYGKKRCVVKVGQYPEWDISISKQLQKSLGDKEEIYKRGLICESQGYGIGAVAYYRRTIEEIINTLLTSISELISEENEEGMKEYKEALKKTRESRRIEEKISLVQDLIPPSLKPEGVNPMKKLYSALSEGIHGKGDEECLLIAEGIRTSLEFLISEAMERKSRVKKFTKTMQKLPEDSKSGGSKKKDKK